MDGLLTVDWKVSFGRTQIRETVAKRKKDV